MGNVRLPLVNLAVNLPGNLPDSGEALSGAGDGGSQTARAESDPPLMQIGDLAREARKTVRAIHLYEQLELLKPAARSKGGYRLYGREALARIRWIGKLQDMGFSLTDIQACLKEWEHLNSAPRAMVKMRDAYKKKLDETREHIEKLQALEHELVASLHYLDTCDVCDPVRLLSACNGCELHECNDAVPDLVAGFRASSGVVG